MPESANSSSLQRQFPCSRCGGKLVFAPGTDSLVCPYCGTRNSIAHEDVDIPLLDYDTYEAEVAGAPETHDAVVFRCNNCGAETHLASDVTAGRCAFCGSPVVAEGESKKLIKPAGLLPFIVKKEEANALFRKWIGGLWFAPSDLAKRSDQAGIDGAYIPCWTYNTDTDTQYTGERGDDYQVTETYTEVVNGRTETRQRTVTHTRWSSVGGQVQNPFRNVLVLATNSLPPKQARHLEPWDLQNLVPYKDDYISGLACQSYQVDLIQGLVQAKQQMEPVIRRSIEADIGGDHQRISSTETRYARIQFRHLLLPLWISAYQYAGKTFRFLINARSAEVQGERPYSAAKIVGLVIGIIGAILVIVLIASHLKH